MAKKMEEKVVYDNPDFDVDVTFEETPLPTEKKVIPAAKEESKVVWLLTLSTFFLEVWLRMHLELL